MIVRTLVFFQGHKLAIFLWYTEAKITAYEVKFLCHSELTCSDHIQSEIRRLNAHS